MDKNSFVSRVPHKREKIVVVEARGYVGNPQGCPSGGRVTAKQLSTGAAYPQPYLFLHRIAARPRGLLGLLQK
jgi:hypothetical protein